MRVGPRHKIVSRAKPRSDARLGSAQFLLARGLARTPIRDTGASLGTAAFLVARGAARRVGAPAHNALRVTATGTAAFLLRRGLARQPAAAEVVQRGRGVDRAWADAADDDSVDPCGGHAGGDQTGNRGTGSAEALLRSGRARVPGPAALVGTRVQTPDRVPQAPDRRIGGVRRGRDFADDGAMSGLEGLGGASFGPDGLRRGSKGLFAPSGLWQHYDAHAHIICPTLDQWNSFLAGKVGADARIPFRVRYLQEFAETHGFEKMVISGWPQNAGEAGAMHDSDDINEVTWQVYEMDPDYFVPFATLLAEDLTGSHADPVAKLTAQFGYHAFQGIGEIYVHSETISLDSSFDDVLFEFCALAATEGVPIQFHWSIGHKDNADAAVTEQDNREQLTRLLDRIVAEIATPPTVILAHCGIGPDTFEADTVSSYFDDWSDYLEDLLSNPDYDFVMLDLAGMQSDANFQLLDYYTGGLTSAGTFIMEMIDGTRGKSYADRFMFATDAQKRGGDAHTLDSVFKYETFLASGAATPDEKKDVRHDNARARI